MRVNIFPKRKKESEMKLIVAAIVGFGFIIVFSIIAFVYLGWASNKEAKDRKKREEAFFKELEAMRRLKKLKAYRPSENKNPE